MEVVDLDSLADAFTALRPPSQQLGEAPPSRAELLRGTIAYTTGMFSALTEVMLDIKQMIAEHAGIPNV